MCDSHDDEQASAGAVGADRGVRRAPACRPRGHEVAERQLAVALPPHGRLAQMLSCVEHSDTFRGATVYVDGPAAELALSHGVYDLALAPNMKYVILATSPFDVVAATEPGDAGRDGRRLDRAVLNPTTDPTRPPETPMQTTTLPAEAQRYAKTIEVSKRIRWDIDRDVIRGREFDLSHRFMPDGLSLVDELPFLVVAEPVVLGRAQCREGRHALLRLDERVGAAVPTWPFAFPSA